MLCDYDLNTFWSGVVIFERNAYITSLVRVSVIKFVYDHNIYGGIQL